MSLTSRSQFEEDAAEPSASAETVLELLDDDCCRTILEALRDGPRPARELVEECEGSRPTVYRRLDSLESAGIVDSRMALHPDGHHRKEFTTELDGVTLELDDGDFSASVATADGGR